MLNDCWRYDKEDIKRLNITQCRDIGVFIVISELPVVVFILFSWGVSIRAALNACWSLSGCVYDVWSLVPHQCAAGAQWIYCGNCSMSYLTSFSALWMDLNKATMIFATFWIMLPVLGKFRCVFASVFQCARVTSVITSLQLTNIVIHRLIYIG